MNGEWYKRQNPNKTESLHMTFHGTTNNYKIKRKLSKYGIMLIITGRIIDLDRKIIKNADKN